MQIHLNTTQPAATAHTPNFQSSALPNASTISSQAAKSDSSKSLLDHIINFFKKIFCCCNSRPQEGNEIARLIEQGKSKEAAEAWVALIEKDAKVLEDPARRFQKWFDTTASTDSYTGSGDFGKKFFDLDQSPEWARRHQAAFIQFIAALPAAVEQSSNPAISVLAQPLREWLRKGPN